MDCIFCKIVNGEAPCYKIYEDEHTLAFLSIGNEAEGHTLVIPKRHCESILDCDSKTLAQVMDTVKFVSEHYVDDCGYDGVNVLNASGTAAQQSVPHLHFHIIPRKENDGMDTWPKMNNPANDLREICEKLKF